MGFIAQALGLGGGGDSGASAAQQRQMDIQQKQEERLNAQEAAQGAALAASIRAGPVAAIVSFCHQSALLLKLVSRQNSVVSNGR